MRVHFYTFWSIDAGLHETRLNRQLDFVRESGFDGVVFHPRFYPADPPYLSAEYLRILSGVILHARKIGLDFWIYDENGWPSGTVGGELIRLHPQYAHQWLEPLRLPEDGVVAEYCADEGGQERRYLAVRRGQGLDYLNPRACRQFIAMTHERYRQGLSPEAFEHVSAFFCDEPELGLCQAYESLPADGAVPWSADVPAVYSRRFGEDIVPRLPLLFTRGDGYREFRVRFREMLTDMFCDSFVTPLDEWCRAHGKRLAAHVKGEEHPLFQVPMTGSCHPVFRKLSLPGIDALERDPSGSFFPRQVASAAAQFGNGESMAECFGGAGWGARPEDLERFLRWIVGHGISHLVLHLHQYRLTSQAIHDWPPSQPAHLNWAAAYPELLRRVRGHAAGQSGSVDTLLVAPYRGVMEEYEPWELMRTNIHNAATYPDTPAGRVNTRFLQLVGRLPESGGAWHVCDERTVEETGCVEAGRLSVGACSYSRLIIAEGVRWNAAGARLIELMRAGGGECIPAGEWASSGSKMQASAVDGGIAAEPIPVRWGRAEVLENHFVLEATERDDGSFVAAFESSGCLRVGVHFADEVVVAALNGVAMQYVEEEDGVRSRAPLATLDGRNELTFRTALPTSQPFIFLQGDFLVQSRSPFLPGPNGTVMTEGPFVLSPRAEVPGPEMVVTGYPFCRGPFVLRADLDVPSDLPAGSVLKMNALEADAACVHEDGRLLGWAWGPDWGFRLGEGLPAGRHTLAVSVFPSTFNFYGPHRHIDGDRHLVSPGQYLGKKNFADGADAPEDTRSSAFHFKPVRLPTENGSHWTHR